MEGMERYREGIIWRGEMIRDCMKEGGRDNCR